MNDNDIALLSFTFVFSPLYNMNVLINFAIVNLKKSKLAEGANPKPIA